MKVWEETRHTHFTKLYTKSWGIIVVEVICTDSCASQNTPMDLHCIHAVHCIHCIPTKNNMKKFMWSGSKGSKVKSCRNWPFQWRVSTCIALALKWQQASSPFDVASFLSPWWIRSQYGNKRDTHMSPSCFKIFYQWFYQSSVDTFALSGNTNGSWLIRWPCDRKTNFVSKISVTNIDPNPTKGFSSSILCGKTSPNII